MKTVMMNLVFEIHPEKKELKDMMKNMDSLAEVVTLTFKPDFDNNKDILDIWCRRNIPQKGQYVMLEGYFYEVTAVLHCGTDENPHADIYVRPK